MPPNSKTINFGTISIVSSGMLDLSIVIITEMNNMARKALMMPCKTPLKTNGRLINPSVAPMSFMLLIVNLFEYTDKRMVLLISAMAIRSNNKLNPNKIKLILRTFLLII